MCEQRFFICKHCGNLIGMIDDAGVPMVCCGENMVELTANTVEASQEKHIPVVEISDDTIRVNVGSVAHPMLDEHYIQWIYVLSEHGGQRKCLKPGAAASAMFKFIDDKPLSVFAYCNIHGLWKVDL